MFGTSELAVAAVLAAYMGGLALGAAAAARYAMRLRRPVLAYGVLELAIALSALSVPAGIRLINAVYVGLLGGGSELPEGGAAAATLFQLGAAFAVLLPPTAFMGATLPLLARHAVRSEAEIGSRVGVLYAVNTAGAIAGTLCAAFWLMPELGLRRTVWVGSGAQRARVRPGRPAGAGRGESADPGRAARRCGARSRRRRLDPSRHRPLGGGLLRLRGALDAAARSPARRESRRLRQHARELPAGHRAGKRVRGAPGDEPRARRARLRRGPARDRLHRLRRPSRWPTGCRSSRFRLGAGPAAPLASAAVAAATLLPITLCIGATFPFAVRLLARVSGAGRRGRRRGSYAWNTVGAIVGALGAGFVLLPGLGFEGTRERRRRG